MLSHSDIDRTKSFLPHTVVAFLLFFAFFVRQYGFIRTVVGTIVAYLITLIILYVVFGPQIGFGFFAFTVAFPVIIILAAIDKNHGTTYADQFIDWLNWLQVFVGA